MKIRRMPSHPEFKLEGRSRHFQSFWELELDAGEETSPHSHFESEEIVYLLDGEGLIRVERSERVVTPGEVVLVPPRVSHMIANRSDRLLRAITVESRFDLGDEEESKADGPRESAATIDRIMEDLPGDVNEALAIQKIVELFDVGGRLSEQIEKALGLDNDDGVGALSTIEKKIMKAVVEITQRYREARGQS
jgi:mannose-6-phosphate isomerase-like protein (cupin superfamily)